MGKSVLLVAADTYRAAAIDQLVVWAKRVDVPIITSQQDSDPPGAVTYDGIKAAIARNIDVVLIDTAGRLHTRFNLMEEIKKVHRVAGKALEGAPHYSWIVLDSTTGQNGLHQAEAFSKAVQLNGAILAKLDTSAKGGMVLGLESKSVCLSSTLDLAKRLKTWNFSTAQTLLKASSQMLMGGLNNV